MRQRRWQRVVARLRRARQLARRHRRALGWTALALLAAALGFGLWTWLAAEAEPPRRTYPRQQILDALRFVESRHAEEPPDGDGGRAIGPYQIHEVYWRDAAAWDRSLGGSYQDCRQRPYAERVIAAYMQRWVPDAWEIGDAEVIARVHNGGPRGHHKQATERYWRKVVERLARP